LRVRDLQKRFGGLHVLRGVDLELRAGEVVALVGENGAGKSTLVECIAGAKRADSGHVELLDRAAEDIAVVWQDLALCDNLSAVANLFLGNERVRGRLLDETAMASEGRRLLAELRISIDDPLAPVATLSGGQRQLVAIARAVLRDPDLLVLDEPTAALGVAESRVVERLIAERRRDGCCVLLVSHRLDQVFNVADRIAVLRNGRVIAELSPRDVHPDDVVALMTGIEMDSTARRQLWRLRGLVEQLAEVEPAASLPLIVTAMAEAVGVEQLCVHLLDRASDANEQHGPRLRGSVAVGLAPALLDVVRVLPIGDDGGPPGIAAATGEQVLVEDCRTDARWARVRAVPGNTGVRSTWSVPIMGSSGVLGTISGYSGTVGRPQTAQLELVSLYASHAAAAIDRERLLAEATRRNRILETLRGVLDTMAGPQPVQGGLGLVLLALCRGLGADTIALHETDGTCATYVANDVGAAAFVSDQRHRAAARAVRAANGHFDRAQQVGGDVLAVTVATPHGRVVVTAWWSDTTTRSTDALDLLDDAARSLHLAFEREALEEANAEAASLRRSHRLQQEFLSRLNHELRTPLTAIQGYASTLRQTDVQWDQASQQRFLDSIASESARMGRLVGDLLDFGAIDSGVLRLAPDWCDLELVIEAARRCVADAATTGFALCECDSLPPIWADHDRLEQVFVNLLENAVRHASNPSCVAVTVALVADSVEVRVVDDGPGIAPDAADRLFLPHVRGVTDAAGTGLGLAIARGIVEAHDGTIHFEAVRRGASVVVRLPIEPATVDS
jgi:signal transduction histidine kinase/ABC-type multidrug transport system ATPase subunit